jgi:hypothetical protein
MKNRIRRIIHAVIATILFFVLVVGGTTYLVDRQWAKQERDPDKQEWYNENFLKQPYMHFKAIRSDVQLDTINIRSDDDYTYYYVKNSFVLDGIQYYTIKENRERIDQKDSSSD